ncbi:hypothetical protein [Marinobacter changyiensis]|uniref:hypothetical protein n=1 Tax=Marinobacter changyiensis TaxID=2604091 RepID=UPI001FE299D9|nr:hypothetical protein [Marinobacter changyiensis]
MAYILAAMFAVLLSLTIVLFWQLQLQKSALAEAMKTLGAIDGAVDVLPEPDMVLTVKVLDPITVAKRESRSARVLADHLPVMVRKMVYQQVMTEMGEQLSSRGIDVEMNIEYR